jgi:hypothetical protein
MVTSPAEAVSEPSNAPTARTVAVIRLIRVRMVSFPFPGE